MVKIFITYFFSLSILLLSGYSQLSAHVHKGSAFSSLVKNIKKSEHASFLTIQDEEYFMIIPSSSGTEKENDKIDAVENKEEEDNKLISLKNNLLRCNYFTSIFRTQTPGYFFNYIKKITHFDTRITHTSSYRYIVLGVFRI